MLRSIWSIVISLSDSYRKISLILVLYLNVSVLLLDLMSMMSFIETVLCLFLLIKPILFSYLKATVFFSLSRYMGVYFKNLKNMSNVMAEGIKNTYNASTCQSLHFQNTPVMINPPIRKEACMMILCFCLKLLSQLSIMMEMVIEMAESAPIPQKKSPRLAIHMHCAQAKTTHPTVQMVQAIHVIFFLPWLSDR